MFDAPGSSAAGIQLIDFAEKRISPDEIKAAGYAGVINYVSAERPGAHRGQADHPRVRGLVARGGFTHRQ